MVEYDSENLPCNLIHAAQDGKLVFFIGAGVSRLLGGYSWNGYALNKLDYLFREHLISFHDKERLSKLNPRELLSICDILFKEKKISMPSERNFLLPLEPAGQESSDVYQNLYSLNAIYVTTNYDDYLDQMALKTKDEDNIKKDFEENDRKVFFLDEDMLISKLLVPGNIIHIHGGMKPEQFPVITIWDYINRYSQDKNLVEFLRYLFKEFCVLFIGYGLAEYEILEYIINVTSRDGNKLDGKGINHFLLYPIFKEDNKFISDYIAKYYQRLGIELLTYEIDQNGYQELENVVRTLTEKLKKLHGEYHFSDKLKIFEGVSL